MDIARQHETPGAYVIRAFDSLRGYEFQAAVEQIIDYITASEQNRPGREDWLDTAQKFCTQLAGSLQDRLHIPREELSGLDDIAGMNAGEMVAFLQRLTARIQEATVSAPAVEADAASLDGARARMFAELQQGNFREALLALAGYVEQFTGMAGLDDGRFRAARENVAQFVRQLRSRLQGLNVPGPQIDSIAEQCLRLEDLAQAARLEIVESVLGTIEAHRAGAETKSETTAMPGAIGEMIREGRYPAAIEDMITYIQRDEQARRPVWEKTISSLLRQLGISLRENSIATEGILDALRKVSNMVSQSGGERPEPSFAQDVMEELKALSALVMEAGSQRTLEDIQALLAEATPTGAEIRRAIEAMIDSMQYMRTADPDLVQTRSREYIDILTAALENYRSDSSDWIVQVQAAFEQAIEASRQEASHDRADASDALQGFLAVQEKFQKARDSL